MIILLPISIISVFAQNFFDFREREWGSYGRCTDQFGINWMVNSKT